MQQVSTFFPFGPPVYLDKIEDKYIEEMTDALDIAYGDEEYDMRDRLAGRIDDQYEIMPLVSDSCKGHIMKHAIQFMTDTGGDPTFMKQTEIDALWVNIQRYMELNPIHRHTGMFSFVIYLENELDRANAINNKFDNARGTELAGHLELRYGEEQYFNWTEYKLWPEKGMIIMFPSWVSHKVYPHYEKDKKRISVAGNIQQII